MSEDSVTSGDGWISDDSSFYGDQNERERLDFLCEESPSGIAWSGRKDDLNAIVFQHRNDPQHALSNPGEGQPSCWQLGETAEDFIKRLPPSTTSRLLYEWIWVHNPHQQGLQLPKAPDVHSLTTCGQKMLANSLQARRSIEIKHQKHAQSIVTRLLNEEAKQLQQNITDLAVETNVLSGKWMLFLSPEDLTRVWRLVVDGVINNRLGPTAKVAPDEGKPYARLICIYTKDFRDKDDIRRVLDELISIGVVSEEGKPIHYKSDPYTYLNIYRETADEYGLQASLYSSSQLRAEDHGNQAVLNPRTYSSLNRRTKVS